MFRGCSVVFACLAIAVAACDGASSSSDQCFQLGETRITVSAGEPRPSLTIVGPGGDAERVVVYGVLEGSSFTYPNGTRFEWDETQGWWKGQKALMDGERADRVACE